MQIELSTYQYQFVGRQIVDELLLGLAQLLELCLDLADSANVLLDTL